MPVSVEIVSEKQPAALIAEVFQHFQRIDEQYSTYKQSSEISQINRGLQQRFWSPEMKKVLALCEITKQETDGYFDVEHNGQLDPSGLVKGWAIRGAAMLLLRHGVKNFMIDAGGDIEAHGFNADNQPWLVGIRNPFNRRQNVKIVEVNGCGVATSGTYIRGQHIYNPHSLADSLDKVASLTVVGPNIYEADRMATAAFAMGRSGINFIERLKGFEGYLIDNQGLATMTSGFVNYTV